MKTIKLLREEEENNLPQMKKLFFLYVWLNLTRIAELQPVPYLIRDKEDLVKHIRKRTIQTGRLFFSSSLTLLSLLFFVQFLDAQPVKKVLIEKYTSAYCGNCPRATNILKDITANEENVIWLSHHSDFIPDAMYVGDLDEMYYDFADSAPRASFDRVLFDDANRVAVTSGTWEDRLTQQLNEPAIAGIAIYGNTHNNQVFFTVDVNFVSAPEVGDLRLSVFAVEDVVVGSGAGYDQSNYDNNNPNSPLYQQGQPIPNYEHLNVTRAIISDNWGTAGIIPDSPEIGTNYSYEYTYQVPEEFDFEKIRIVAALHYYDENDLNKHYLLNANEDYVASFLGINTTEPNTPTLTNFPNPFSKHTFIEINNLPQNVTVLAYSLTGKIIAPDYQIESSGIKVDATTLASGVYVYEVLAKDGMVLGNGRWVVK